jgi:hypothetical protein
MKKAIAFWAGVVVAIIIALWIAIWVPGDAQTKVASAIAYAGLIMIFLFGYMILAGIATGTIDISGILEEKGTGDGAGKASMSRFQLLVFTFVIAVSLFLIVVNTKEKFPDIPANVLMLLGISATTYGVSKGIQASAESKSDDKKPASDKSTETRH